MKVFLSWSGHKSHQIALVFRDWLPSVIQTVTPYVSSEDIDKGTRWSTDIAKELEDSTFGILCVTKENLEAPWLLFEAGALSKMMDKSYVCPFIFDLKRTEVKGPILQFQSTIFEKEDVRKLLFTLNRSCGKAGLKEELLSKTFEVWWPNFYESIEAIKAKQFEEEEKSSTDMSLINERLEEMVNLTRANQKILSSPEILFPSQYFESLISEKINKELFLQDRSLASVQHHIMMKLKHLVIQALDLLEAYKNEKECMNENFYKSMRESLDRLLYQLTLVGRNSRSVTKK